MPVESAVAETEEDVLRRCHPQGEKEQPQEEMGEGSRTKALRRPV